MMVWFYVVAADGAIVRFGTCPADDVFNQAGPGEIVIAFETNPGITDSSHTYDLQAATFNPRQPVQTP